MNRLTVNIAAREMTMTELAHNCMYARDGWAWYRDFDKDENLLDFIREFGKAENLDDLPDDNEALAEMLLDDLQYGIDNPLGRVALVYNLMWAMADLREVLKAYEDTGLTPEEIVDGQMLTGWIPVEEQLPKDGTYLCTLDGELCGIEEPFTGLCGIENGVWDEPDCVIAWMPLPEPYDAE